MVNLAFDLLELKSVILSIKIKEIQKFKGHLKH